MRHTEYLDEQVDRLQVCEFVVVRIHADAEEQAGVAAVHDFVVAELGRRDGREPPLTHGYWTRTSTKFDWYFWSLGATNRCTSPLSRTYGIRIHPLSEPDRCCGFGAEGPQTFSSSS